MTTTQMQITITVVDRNEVNFLFTWGFIGTPSPRTTYILDFEFEATEALFEARKAYSLNHSVPILSFVAASKYVDKLIHQHRQQGGVAS